MGRFKYDEVNWDLKLTWLMNISKQMIVYSVSSYDYDFQTMLEAMQQIYDLVTPKAHKETTNGVPFTIVKCQHCNKEMRVITDVEKKLEWLEENVPNVYVTDEEGNMVRINPQNRNMMKKEMRNCYRMILKVMDDEGILEKLKQDPNKAMGNFTV